MNYHLVGHIFYTWVTLKFGSKEITRSGYSLPLWPYLKFSHVCPILLPGQIPFYSLNMPDSHSCILFKLECSPIFLSVLLILTLSFLQTPCFLLIFILFFAKQNLQSPFRFSLMKSFLNASSTSCLSTL